MGLEFFEGSAPPHSTNLMARVCHVRAASWLNLFSKCGSIAGYDLFFLVFNL